MTRELLISLLLDMAVYSADVLEQFTDEELKAEYDTLKRKLDGDY